MDTINVSAFKAHRLTILDYVSATGEYAVIVKRVRTVAKVGPVRSVAVGYPQVRLERSITAVGAIMEPALAVKV